MAAPLLALSPLDRGELAAFLRRQVVDYADAKVKAGVWPLEGAADRARRELNAALTQGGDANRFLKAVGAEGATVGWAWLGPPPVGHPAEAAYLYQITVDDASRGRGLGRALLALVEEDARRRGAREMRLNVFRHNAPALALYARAGYSVVDEDAVSRRLSKRLA